MATGQRPLSEISPLAQRRNSPSWNQSNQDIASGDSSPFESSPLNASNSPRLFWQGRDPGSPYRLNIENKSPYETGSPFSPQSKRSSIENLKRASRVKNSNMFAREHKQEYNPSEVHPIERPLAGGRPLSHQFQGKQYREDNSDARRQLPSQTTNAQQGRKDTMTPPGTTLRHESPQQSNAVGAPTMSPPSPAKSSLSKASRYGGKSVPFDPRREIWSDDEGVRPGSPLHKGRSSHRQTKSVTFDAAPPQVNEYEMTTPAPSSIASSSREGSYDSEENDDSYDCESSFEIEDSFDASLEDTEKTPVVLPHEWRFMSPGSSNDEMMDDDDDPFCDEYGSPGPEVNPSSTNNPRQLHSRIESLDSNGEHRPLPPLPPSNMRQSPEGNSLSGTMERASTPRELPSPLRPASCSKADINGISNGSLSLEDRLRLMMAHEDENHLSEAEKQRERRMRRAGAKERSVERESEIQQLTDDEHNESAGEYTATPRISRDSILRNIQNQETNANEFEDSSFSSDRPNPLRPFNLDPDTPIPSLESDNEIEDDMFPIKEEMEDEIDLYSIPEFCPGPNEGDVAEDQLDHGTGEDDNSSHYSHGSKEYDLDLPDETRDDMEDDQTHVPFSEYRELPTPSTKEQRVSDISNNGGDNQLDVEFLSYVDQSTPPADEQIDPPSQLDMTSIRNSLQRSETPEESDDDALKDDDSDGNTERPQTPDSVIRHPVSEDTTPEPPSTVPDPIATIKAPGAALKTRPSLTPADVDSMAATRRKVSGQTAPSELTIATEDSDVSQEISAHEDANSPDSETDVPHPATDVTVGEKRQSSLVKLDIPVSGNDGGLEFGLDEEFDRVIEAQKVAFNSSISHLSQHTFTQNNIPNKEDAAPLNPYSFSDHNFANTSMRGQRGYLMRQNTKVVVASSRQDDGPNPGYRDANAGVPATGGPAPTPNSPRKASQMTWTTEPWNGKSRRQSIKMAGAVARKKVGTEPVPPLPGQESNVKDTPGGVDDVEINVPCDTLEEGEDRGRLFVKVVGVKDLDLPLPRGERSNFSLTLDNGLHCVTTSWLELGKTAPIGQEFELVVLQDLEFQLTLQVKPDHLKPKITPSVPSTPTKSPKSQKTSTFSRVFASPKKRREMELRQQQEVQQQRKADEKTVAANKDPWDKMRKLAAHDGSFARAYVSLGDYEQQAFGRPLSVDITCFNEWAVDEVMSSMKSKRSTVGPAGSGVQRRPPYRIGTLELQLLFVPKPKGATDDDMPKSMNACIREMREADNAAVRSWEGFLSQQGGDCPYWRRRFFKLQGTKLTAYHEVTRQPRATINLAKASKLIDDKCSLTQRETSAKGGRRRKSAFAEEEEGYMFVEEGFRIRFGNGEVIDFYADSRVEKEGWMNVLAETVGKGYSAGNGQVKPWTDVVLRAEKSFKAKAQTETTDRPLGKRPQNPPPTPKSPQMSRPATSPQKPRHKLHSSQSEIPQQKPRHQKSKSLIY